MEVLLVSLKLLSTSFFLETFKINSSFFKNPQLPYHYLSSSNAPLHFLCVCFCFLYMTWSQPSAWSISFRGTQENQYSKILRPFSTPTPKEDSMTRSRLKISFGNIHDMNFVKREAESHLILSLWADCRITCLHLYQSMLSLSKTLETYQNRFYFLFATPLKEYFSPLLYHKRQETIEGNFVLSFN